MQKYSGKILFRKLFKYLRPKIIQYAAGILGMDITGTATIILTAFTLKYVVDMQTYNQAFLSSRILFMFIALIGSFLCIPITYFMYQSAVKKAMMSVKSEFINHIQRLPMEYYDRHSSGELISRVTQDMTLVERIYAEMVQTISGTLILGIGSIVFMLILDWRVSFILIATSIFSIWVNKFITIRMQAVQKTIAAKKDQLTDKILEFLKGFYTIRIYNYDKVIGDGQALNSDIHKNALKNAGYGAFLDGMNYMAGFINFIGAICISSILIIRNITDLGSVIALVILQMNISETFLKLGNAVAELKTCLAGAGRVLEIIDLPKEAEVHDNTLNILNDIPEIKIRNLTFKYDSKKVLQGISFSVSKGELVVLTGVSGCGKSTILKLLMRYYSVRPSMINLEDVSIEQYSIRTIRSKIAYVPQDNYLFHGSIRDNIACARPDAKEEEIIQAAIAAHAHFFILELADGYDTILEESGNNLSAGQCQRIALARAFIKKAPILILDEATAFLDTESEQHIIAALKELSRESIVILVSHRVSTIEKADRIVMIDKGKVAVQGNHDILMVKSKFYADYFRSLITN